jgi:hypothetical protein
LISSNTEREREREREKAATVSITKITMGQKIRPSQPSEETYTPIH